MDLLPSNITFAIIVSDEGWRTDLTIRFCEYFGQKLNGDKFSDKIIIAKSVDDAMERCVTSYLLVLSGGFIPFSMSFFEALDQKAAEKSSIFYSFFMLAEDYVVLDARCIFFNLPLWRGAGKPLYDNFRLKQGPPFKVTVPNKDHAPHEIERVEGETVFVPGICGQNGAALVIKQLETFDKLTSMSYVVPAGSYHFLSTATALEEIHTETEFEKKLLPPIFSKVYSYDDDTAEHGENSIEIIVAPAQGLKPLTLAEHYGASRIIIYDNNPLSLELQRAIFSVTAPMTYGEIIKAFTDRFPGAILADSWEKDQHALICPLVGVEVEFNRIDLFSFQAEEFFKSIDHAPSMLVDLSDIYVFPYNYYRRPLYQVQGLFAELYSILKSRTGPTTILGLAPGFQRMDTIEINTATIQFQMDPTIDFTQKELEGEVPVPLSPIMYVPPTLPQHAEKYDWKPPLKNADIATPPPRSAVSIAAELGYSVEARGIELNGKQVNATCLSLKQETEGFTALLEYTVDEAGWAWTFKVGTPGDARRIELKNGETQESFKKHLLTEVKFNPATMIKYFKKK